MTSLNTIGFKEGPFRLEGENGRESGGGFFRREKDERELSALEAETRILPRLLEGEEMIVVVVAPTMNGLEPAVETAVDGRLDMIRVEDWD